MPGDGEQLYDQFLDGWLSGTGEDATAFLARHPHLDAQWRGRIRQLHDVLAQRGEPQRERLPFDKLGDYRLLRRIGGGGMGTVYLAEQLALRRLIALKIVRPEFQASATALERFQREARAVARLRHHNVVRIQELGEDQGTHFIAMEYVPGRPLAELLAEDRPHVSRVLRWADEIAQALEEAHEQGVVHRDVKPSNILITPDDRPVLLDFGMAHLKESEASRLTKSFAGSPSYAAPEQLAEGVPIDRRTDIYALGATLYECLTGRPPFDGDSVEAVLAKVMRDEPLAPRRLDVTIPADVETVTIKALAKRPIDRYQTARAFGDDLRALREARRIAARRPSWRARTRMWARAHPVRATMAGAACLAVLALLASWALRVQARHRDAAQLVADAGRRVTRYREDRIRSIELWRRFFVLQDRTEDSYLTDAQDRELDQVSRQVDELKRRRTTAFHEVVNLLERARQLDPGVGGVEEVRARLYLEKFEEAWAAEDWVTAAFYRDLVSQTDPTGSLTGHWRQPAVVTIDAPPDTEIYVFRDRELNHRFVPVAEHAEPHPLLQRGEFAWRVERGAGRLKRGDVIVRREESRVRVYRMGKEFDATLPAVVVLRRTATPLLATPGCRVAPGEFTLTPGTVRFLMRRPGFEDQVVPAQLDPGTRQTLATAWHPAGTTPDGFRYIPACFVNQRAYWIQEHEVTCGQYLKFLNAPQTRREIDHAKKLIRVPRGPDSLTTGDFSLGEDGYRISPEWGPDSPVLGVSFEDAEAYARWMSRRDGRNYALPNRHEWTNAAGVWMKRAYVFGQTWRPKWVSSCYAKPAPAPEQVMSYPIDESVFGVYDLTGSAAEWIDDWFDQNQTMKRLGGSSWGHAEAQIFRIWHGSGSKPSGVSHTFGFRLVIRP